MKKLFILSLILFIAQSGRSQNVSACNNAQNICSNPNFLFQGISGSGLTSGLNISNPGTNPQIGNGANPSAAANAGCLLTNGPGPQWLLLTVNASGNLGFSFGAPGSANPQVGLYDWEMWLYNSSTCDNIFNNTQPPVSCNWNGSGTGGTGMGPVPLGGSPSNYQPSIPVTVGQQYLILISNYSGVTTPVSFTSTGTAGLSCGFNTSICAGGTATVSHTGYAPLTNSSYTLFPSGTTNLTGSFVVTPSVTTIYTIQCSGLNSSSLQTTQTSTTNVTVNPQPFSSPTTTQTTCTGTVNGLNLNITFNPQSPPPTYTVAWSPTPNGTGNATQSTFTGGISPGTYTAVITAQGGCTTSTMVTINPFPAASVFTTVPGGSIYSVTCTQPTVVLDGSDPAYSYTWTNGVTAPLTGVTTSYTPFNLGNWTVVGVNPVSGCVSSKTFTVVLNNTPPVSNVNPVNQSINCGPGAIATVTGTAISPTINVSHVWYGPGGFPPTAPVGGVTSIYNPGIVGANGTSTYVLTNLVNGCTTTKTVQVVSNAGAYPSFAVTSSSTQSTFTLGCTTRSVTDVNIVNGNTTPPGGSISYTILPPGFSGINYTTTTVNTYSINSPGTYTVIVKDNNNLCETRIPLSVVQNTFPPNITTSAITQTLTCDVPSVVLQGTTSTQNVTYVWKTNSVPPSVPNASITVNTTTAGASVASATVIDVYTLTVVDASSLGNNCPSSTVVTMYQNTRPPKPAIVGAVPLTCLTFSVNLTNNSTTGVLPNTFFGNQPIVATLWEGPTPQLPQPNSSTYLGYTAGIYTMTVKDLNNGCTSKTTTTIGDNRVYPTIITNSQVPLDCGAAASGGVKLAASVVGIPPSGVTAQWFTPDPTPNISNPNTLTLTTNGVGDYKLVVSTNSNGCVSSAVVKVINGVLTANFTADQTTGFAPLTVNFTNNSASSSTATASSSITSVWSFGNGTTRTTTTNVGTSAVYAQPGTYTVTMFAGKGTCLDTFVQVIRVDIPSKLEVPNVFTPNGDGTNDLFFVKTANLSEITALIYDRWGNKIYELTTEKGNIAWDGKSNNGKEAPDGTYFYIITAKGKDGQTYDTKGTVSLYR